MAAARPSARAHAEAARKIARPNNDLLTRTRLTHTRIYTHAHAGCKFYPVGENRRFERVAENLPIGSEILKLEAHPRSEFKIEPIDNSLSDVNYFKYVDIDDRFVAIKLNQSLEDLVDRVSHASKRRAHPAAAVAKSPLSG